MCFCMSTNARHVTPTAPRLNRGAKFRTLLFSLHQSRQGRHTSPHWNRIRANYVLTCFLGAKKAKIRRALAPLEVEPGICTHDAHILFLSPRCASSNAPHKAHTGSAGCSLVGMIEKGKCAFPFVISCCLGVAKSCLHNKDRLFLEVL